MNILVTGSSGLVGERLVAALRARGETVVAFDLRPAPGGEVGDIRDRAALRAAMAGCDGIYHLAAVSRVAWGEIDPATCHEINVTATQVLVDEAVSSSDRPWIVFASSREVYGDPVTSPVREGDPIAPVNAYGRSKAEAEIVITSAREAGLRTATVRLSNVYGTCNDHPDRAVPALLWRALQGSPIQLTGGDNYFDFVHVDDCVAGLMIAAARLAAGQADLPTVHLATGVATSLITLAEAAKTICNSNSPIDIVPARAFDVTGFCGDPGFAERTLGWRADVSLDRGMAGLLAEMRGMSSAIPTVPRPDAQIGTLAL